MTQVMFGIAPYLRWTVPDRSSTRIGRRMPASSRSSRALLTLRSNVS